MSTPNTNSLASLGEVSISVSDLLRRLHQSRRLVPLLREIVAEECLLLRAKEAGLSVVDAELQQAANHFRHRHGLTTADATHRWLAREGLSVDEFETGLERELLIEKFKDHLLTIDGEAYFRDRHAAFARVRLRRMVVATEGLAREILAQVREEGRDFEELATARSTDPAAGDLGEMFRGQLKAAIAEAVFAARPGDVAGPFHTPQGYELYGVGVQRASELDGATSAVVREELFAAWVRDRMAQVRIDPDGLDNP
jgi:parvulin-like peptidyl-prolyl isomerase